MTTRSRAYLLLALVFSILGVVFVCVAGDLLRAGARESMVAATLTPLLLLGSLQLARTSRSPVGRERAAREVIIIGRNRRTSRILETLERNPDPGLKVVGVLDTEPCCASVEHKSACNECDELLARRRIPQLGDPTQLTNVIEANPVDEVLITLPLRTFYDEISRCLRVCTEAGVPVSLTADFFGVSAAEPKFRNWHENDYLLNYARTHRPQWKVAAKRGMDVAGAICALAVFALPMLLIALLVKITSRGPVFFRQERATLNNKPFRLLKFRTMVRDAEQRRHELEHLNEQSGPVFKINRDPRITPLGRFLRKYSLDELPQLFNVLRGDLSLVGPRPPMPSEVIRYEWWQRRRLSMRPGLTCLWQVSGRNRIGFDEWMKLDLAYIDNWSLLLDVKLLLRTIPVLLRGTGV
ncbi:MAG: sugar transferase [Planctomycetes bacterium]|nr:sugar transferase [Planctomycetota bacterium]